MRGVIVVTDFLCLGMNQNWAPQNLDSSKLMKYIRFIHAGVVFMIELGDLILNNFGIESAMWIDEDVGV